MSEFLAEARILVRPDTTRFRRELEAGIAAATGKPVVIPVTAQFVGSGTAATQEFAASQEAATRSTLGLQQGLELENSLLAKNAVLMSADAGAAERDAAAQQRLGAEKTRTAASTKALASQQALAATAAQKLAFAEAEVAGAASGVSAAQVRLTRSAAAVAAAERALVAAIEAKNIALIDAAAGSLNAARAYATEAEAALLAARAEAEHAATLGAVGTAGIASGASLLGLRGAVLTAGAAFLGATVAIQASVKAIKGASDTVEELNKSVEVFGDSSQQIKDFAQTTATSLGISNVEALRATGIFGNLFRSINIATPAAAAMSEQLVRLASDLASFNNADPSQVLDNLRSGLVGEPEPLRKFGIFLSQARAQQEALIETGKKSVKELTQQEIVQARYNLILQDSIIAQGDFARTSESLANSTRTLKAELSDLGADLGATLIPFLTNTAVAAGNVTRSLGDLQKIAARVVSPLGDVADAADRGTGPLHDFRVELTRVLSPGASFRAATGEIANALDILAGNTRETTAELPRLSDALDAGARAARLAAFAIVSAQAAIRDLGQELNALDVQRLKIQTGLVSGGRGAEEENLREQIELDKQAVAAAKSGSAARRQALLDLKADQDALASLQQKDAQDAEENANATKDAALKAQRAQQEADRALLGILSARLDDAERKASRAAETAGLQDDIKAQDRIQALIKIQIAKIRAQVKDEETRRDAIRELRIALIKSRAEEDALRKERAQEQAAQKREGIELDIELADINENTKRSIALRLKLIAQLKREAKILHLQGNALKQNRNEIARIRKEIEDLQKEEKTTKQSGQSIQQFLFEQLQAQQGFASNLLGNLITGSTAGLVGNISTARGPVDVGAQVTVAADVQAGKLGAGPTGGQVQTTNDLLRRILAQLRNLNTDREHPEATRQRRTQMAVLDYEHGQGGVM